MEKRKNERTVHTRDTHCQDLLDASIHSILFVFRNEFLSFPVILLLFIYLFVECSELEE